MEIVQALLTKNPCYASGRTITPKGLMLHSVGVNQPNAQVFIKSWNSPSYNAACVHGFIDANDGKVYQTLPWTTRGWHCGRSGNNTHIGVEMCEPKDIHYYKGSSRFYVTEGADINEVRACVARTYQSAVELFAFLCKKFNLDPLKPGVICSHHEGYLAGIATNHGDPEHLWSKESLGLGYTMDQFRTHVNAAMKGGQNESTAIPFPPFKVEVTGEGLWIRQGPSLAHPRVQAQPTTGKGVFTIVAVEGNFGHLKSGAGWINLKNELVRFL